MVRVRETQTERSVKITRHGGTNFLSLWNRGRALAEADGDVLKRKIYEISGNNKANFNWIPRRGSYGFLIKRAPRYHGERAAITATPASGLFKLFHCFRFWPSIDRNVVKASAVRQSCVHVSARTFAVVFVLFKMVLYLSYN